MVLYICSGTGHIPGKELRSETDSPSLSDLIGMLILAANNDSRTATTNIDKERLLVT
jgi:hypothetical protein